MPEKEYIERNKAIDACFNGWNNNAHDCAENIRAIPAADVRPVVHARPVKIFNDPWTGKMFTTCSACDGKIGHKDNFCKHCGADMKEE